MRQIQRKRCVITGAEDLEPLYTFRNFPVFMGVTGQDKSHDLTMDMEWSISRTSGIIQLSKLLPLETVYPESHGSGQVGMTWATHHRTLANFIHQFNPSSVFEIGGGHGILSREYNLLSGTTHNPRWVILEPNPTPAEGVTAEYIQGFFDGNFTNRAIAKADFEFEMVVHSHLLEHTYHPREFLSHLQRFIKPNGILAFSIPNLPVMLRRKYCNAINFEHTFYYDEETIEYLLSNHGFKLIRKEYFRDDHSILYAAIRTEDVEPVQLNKSDTPYEKNLHLFNEYIDFYQQEIRQLNQQITSSKEPVYLFGAHIFSQYLLNFGLQENTLAGILDNDVNKHGKRLYGSDLLVSSPLCLKGAGSCNIILRAGAYNQEIKHDILSNINRSVSFW